MAKHLSSLVAGNTSEAKTNRLAQVYLNVIEVQMQRLSSAYEDSFGIAVLSQETEKVQMKQHHLWTMLKIITDTSLELTKSELRRSLNLVYLSLLTSSEVRVKRNTVFHWDSCPAVSNVVICAKNNEQNQTVRTFGFNLGWEIRRIEQTVQDVVYEIQVLIIRVQTSATEASRKQEILSGVIRFFLKFLPNMKRLLGISLSGWSSSEIANAKCDSEDVQKMANYLLMEFKNLVVRLQVPFLSFFDPSMRSEQLKLTEEYVRSYSKHIAEFTRQCNNANNKFMRNLLRFAMFLQRNVQKFAGTI
ncbi:hypothetical protein EG68_00501 [Paragonimus skrjabini miyazakii]|uniref:Uncharacterized protein n=1 Tax=Paragonimus skrjabini miyazakii TaxID=59628 RepID=A0A8S9ZCC1_9TREM|nr:hypothetical protein EG68_00501 [Paragonimus skrjabini miyazakii]